MTPVRKSNGYTQEGKKKYLRYFLIKKIAEKETPIEHQTPVDSNI